MLNLCQFIGNLGRDPEIRTMQSGDKIATLNLGVSDRWKDKDTGEKRERTEWVRVVVFNQHIVKVCEQYLRKGAKLYVSGSMETRKWQDQSGQDRYSTEVVLRPYKGELTMLDGRGEGGGQSGGYDGTSGKGAAPVSLPDDQIPF